MYHPSVVHFLLTQVLCLQTIRRCLTSGFFLKAAVRQEDGLYKTLVGNKVSCFYS